MDAFISLHLMKAQDCSRATVYGLDEVAVAMRNNQAYMASVESKQGSSIDLGLVTRVSFIRPKFDYSDLQYFFYFVLALLYDLINLFSLWIDRTAAEQNRNSKDKPSPMKHLLFPGFVRNDYSSIFRNMSNEERASENNTYPDFSSLLSIIESDFTLARSNEVEAATNIPFQYDDDDVFLHPDFPPAETSDNNFDDDFSSFDEFDSSVSSTSFSMDKTDDSATLPSDELQFPRPKRTKKRRERRKPLESKTLLAKSLMEWLENPDCNPNAIKWISKSEGLFQITDSIAIANLWGGMKGNKKMTHEKLSRALRHYYKDGTLVRQDAGKKKLHYKFSEAAMAKFRVKSFSK